MKQLRLPVVFFITILLVSISLGVVGVQASEPKIPNPTPEFYSNDFADVLDTSTERYITSLGESTYKSTDGGQVVFVSIDTLNGSTIEEYANTLFNKWGIGTEDKGILFILSLQERESRIEVGYGYEGVLTDIESNRLLVKFAELNKEKGMDEAVKAIYSDITNIISGNEDLVQYPETSEARQQTGEGSSFFSKNPIVSAILVIFVVILVILDFVFTGGQVTFFIIRMAAVSAGRGGGSGGGRGNFGGGGRSGGGGSSGRF